MQVIAVAIAEANTLVREGLKHVITSERDFSIVGQTGSADEVARMVEASHPSVLLLGMEAYKSNPQILEMLKSKSPLVKVAILCSISDNERIFDAVESGARAFLLKSIAPSRLMQALRKIHQGQIWVDSEMKGADKFLEVAARLKAGDGWGADDEIIDRLSKRELEILTLVAEGLTNAEIAKKLFVSPQTVKQHLHHVFDKLNTKNRTQAALLMQKTVTKS